MVKRTLETIVLIVLIFACGYLWGRYGKPKEIISHNIEYITIAGAVVTETNEVIKEKPYAIVVEKIGDEWKINNDMSTIPRELKIHSLSHDTEFDWLSPFRLGLDYDLDLNIAYNPLTFHNIEAGLIVDVSEFIDKPSLDEIGLDAGYRWRNLVAYGAWYPFDGSVSIGVSVKLF